MYQHSHTSTVQIAVLTNVGVVTEFGEVGIEGDTMVTQTQEFFCQRIKLFFDKLDFFIDRTVESAKMMSPILLERMDLSHCIELEQE